MLVQDVTVTLNLSDMTKEEYQKAMKTLEALSCGMVDTNTYDPETNPGEADLTPENQALHDEMTS